MMGKSSAHVLVQIISLTQWPTCCTILLKLEIPAQPNSCLLVCVKMFSVLCISNRYWVNVEGLVVAHRDDLVPLLVVLHAPNLEKASSWLFFYFHCRVLLGRNGRWMCGGTAWWQPPKPLRKSSFNVWFLPKVKCPRNFVKFFLPWHSHHCCQKQSDHCPGWMQHKVPERPFYNRVDDFYLVFELKWTSTKFKVKFFIEWMIAPNFDIEILTFQLKFLCYLWSHPTSVARHCGDESGVNHVIPAEYHSN